MRLPFRQIGIAAIDCDGPDHLPIDLSPEQEIMARIVEQAFYELDAPVARVCSQEVPVPYARHLEPAALPDVAGIVSAARALVR